MKINKYLDSTYLKTPQQAGISQDATKQNVVDLINEAIKHNFILVMIRPEFVSLAKEMIIDANSAVTIGTVIGFHEGTNPISKKLIEAKKAIDDSVDDLDYVINYEAFKEGNVELIKDEVLKGTELGLHHGKIVKWIIEVAALNDEQIKAISKLIRDVVLDNFDITKAKSVFVKSSTGFYKSMDGKPVGATFEAMKLIVENSKPLSAKAAGGVRSLADAVKMVNMGVSRIGTSSALKIFQEKSTENNY